ncbi:Zn-ribbon domain-containing OB-fold protein [Desulfatibacillum aliphaticivorans]|uniref:Zn-ribbon domain-containing OB-fold protein n=1 Tax=Desulfatibacillum aliphaticivorans TaxID=218208 RepID=UPI0003FA8C1B|nr:Zn-ribbon domain-containing OB-fold protein [Desulfatibacillum aliphaticivorans]
MEKWLEQVEPLTFKGQIAVPYTWWAGETGSLFLMGLRDKETIMGCRCNSCGTVYVPPRRTCAQCFTDTGEWVQLSNEGTVQSYTVVRFSHPLQPVEVPFAYAMIQLDGADVSLVHLIKKDLDKLEKGVRVRACFKEKSERKGHILDIDGFEII